MEFQTPLVAEKPWGRCTNPIAPIITHIRNKGYKRVNSPNIKRIIPIVSSPETRYATIFGNGIDIRLNHFPYLSYH